MPIPPRLLSAAALACCAMPAAAQDAGEPGVSVELPTAPAEDTVFDGDFLSLGIGLALGPSYTGSDDYQLFPLPLVQGSFSGVDIEPRGAGVALNFLPERESGPSLSLGPIIRFNLDRVNETDDPVVDLYGELDLAVEVGPTVGVNFPAVLNPFDTFSISVDAVWDIAGAHGGMAVNPSVSYFTPVSRAAAVSLSVNAMVIDDDYADYYYSVPALPAAPAGASMPAGLPIFKAEGGLQSYGVNLLAGYDLDGDLTNGGLALAFIGGYSRLTGDAKDTPFTSIRGDADQWFGGVGLAYTFGS